MPGCNHAANPFRVMRLIGLLAMLVVCTDAPAWSRYPVAYPQDYRYYPPAFGAPPAAFGRVPPMATAPAHRPRSSRTVSSGKGQRQSASAAGQTQAGALPAALTDESLPSAERKRLFIDTL